MGLEGLTASVEQRKPFFGGLTGYTAKMTVTDKHRQASRPWRSKAWVLLRKEPVITIKPNDSSPGSLPTRRATLQPLQHPGHRPGNL